MLKRVVLLLVVFALIATMAWGAWAKSVSPCLHNGHKWRVAYYEGGPWADYKDTILAMVRSLMALGWIESQPLPDIPDSSDTKAVWNWLSTKVQSDYLEFPADGFYSARWDDALREKNRQDMLDSLKHGKFDFVWALGTWAGLDLVNNEHHVPTMVMSTSNPVTAGIISDSKYSGFDHVHVRTDPTRVQRQVRLFHDILGFSRLGIIYEDTDYGRAYAYLNEVKAAAEDGGFELVSCVAPNDKVDDEGEDSNAEYVACAKRLAPKIDAFLYDDHTGAKPSEVGKTLPIFIRNKVATWSTRGTNLVQRGVLMAIAKKDFASFGGFYAETMALILNGAHPGDLNQIFRSRFRLALNRKTAELIGFEPPPNLLKVSDDIYTTIDPPLEDIHE